MAKISSKEIELFEETRRTAAKNGHKPIRGLVVARWITDLEDYGSNP